MSNNKNFQKKANTLFLQYPNENKVYISENGQCFFDEKAAKNYHEVKGFETEPEVFFREGFEDEDDTDVQEALHKSELERLNQAATLEEIAAVCDLDQEYTPANAETDETLTAVISLREKLAGKDQELIQANAQLETLSTVGEENTKLKEQLDAALKENKALTEQINNPKTEKDASKTNSTKA